MPLRRYRPFFAIAAATGVVASLARWTGPAGVVEAILRTLAAVGSFASLVALGVGFVTSGPRGDDDDRAPPRR
jgi:hypothetical protein